MAGHAVGRFIFSWAKSIGFSVDRIFKNCIIKTFKASTRGFVCILGKREGKIPSGKTFLKEGPVLFIVHKGVEYRPLEEGVSVFFVVMFLVLLNASAWSSVCLRAGEMVTDTTGPACSTSHCHPNSAQPQLFQCGFFGESWRDFTWLMNT